MTWQAKCMLNAVKCEPWMRVAHEFGVLRLQTRGLKLRREVGMRACALQPLLKKMGSHEYCVVDRAGQ